MENWKEIENFEAYEVSDLGRVRRRLPGKRTRVGRLLRLGTGTGGYVQVGLHKNSKRHFKNVHILVAKAFLENPLNLPEVNHKGPKQDCRACMLEWRTKRGNELHKMQSKNNGVSFEKESGKYRACYSPAPYKRVWLGRFRTKEEAAQARKEALKKLPHIT